MTDDKVSAIRPGVSVTKPKRRSRRETQESCIKDRLYGFQHRIGHAAALARAMAFALDGKVLPFEIEATDGCLGVAELLDGIRADMYDFSQSKTTPP